MKPVRIFLVVFIFGATILRMLDVKYPFSTAPKPGALFRDCPDCPEMVILPAGSFTMGAEEEEKFRGGDSGGRFLGFLVEPPRHGFSLRYSAWAIMTSLVARVRGICWGEGLPVGGGWGPRPRLIQFGEDPESAWGNPRFCRARALPWCACEGGRRELLCRRGV